MRQMCIRDSLTGAVQKEDLGIAEILAGDYEGKNIKVKGAIHTIRDMGEVAFIVLRRRDGLVPVSYTHLDGYKRQEREKYRKM